MNARNLPNLETPRGDMPPTRWAGVINPHSPRWGGSFAASPADSGTSESAGPPSRDDPRVVAALEEYLSALRAGHPPSREEFLAQHHEIADELGECLSVLEFVDMASMPLAGSDGAAADHGEPIAPRAQLGDYRILREVGRGGMGVVYEAQQVSLGRRVALKVLPVAAAIDPKQRQRFQIEAQAAAQLQHPHIVPIFGVGCDRGIHYYVMQFVDGRSLAAILHDLRRDRGLSPAAGEHSVPASAASTEEAPGAPPDGPASRDGGEPRATGGGGAAESRPGPAGGPAPSAAGPPPAPTAVEPLHLDRDFWRYVARLGAEAAEALDHAHGLGILHRDIKPANLLIDPQGAVWITDFGLARFPGELSLTGTGDLVGTLRYMSPEQALARRGVVDQRTDVYSLGLTLYELLTLRPAFHGRDHQELLRQIAQDEPPPPRRINPAIPRDLETIVLKAMAKDLSRRYATAQELAADLRRFLAGEAILARRPGAVERAVRWCRRHRELVIAAAAAAVVSLAGGTTFMGIHTREVRTHAARTAAAARKAEQASNAYYHYMIESYPLMDRFAREAISQALNQALTKAGPTGRDEALGIFDQWLRVLQELSELPRTDRESRIVIGRAGTRLGYARTLLSMAKRTPDGRYDPALLAQAADDYLRASLLFEELLAESPGDAKVRRYLADALGVFGRGCSFRFAGHAGEAESCYRLAIQYRRDVVRGARPDGDNSGARVDVAGEVDNFTLLVATVRILAGMREDAGQRADAEALIRGLHDDVVALAARFPGPEFQGLRTMLGGPLMEGSSTARPEERRAMIQNCEWALILVPDEPTFQNNLAWALAFAPEDPRFDPKRALELARQAVKLGPLNWTYWNTLGVAAYRLRDWDQAANALQASIRINGGAGLDCFLLAMTRWQQGKRQEARQLFDQAVAWSERARSEDHELRRFHGEAAALLGLPGPQAQAGQG